MSVYVTIYNITFIYQESLSIVSVGSREPTEAQLEKVFHIETAKVKTVLNEWKGNGHPAYQHGSWNIAELEDLETNHVPLRDILDDCIVVENSSAESNVRQASSSYTNESEEQADTSTSVNENGSTIATLLSSDYFFLPHVLYS